jgi:hypothetical protein
MYIYEVWYKHRKRSNSRLFTVMAGSAATAKHCFRAAHPAMKIIKVRIRRNGKL